MTNAVPNLPSPVRAGAGVLPAQTGAGGSFHDFRDVTGDPLVKTWPITSWRSWARRTDRDF